MTPQTKALTLALEALTATMSTHGFKDAIDEVHDKAITAIKEALSSPNGEAQPEQKQNLKLMPREATREMLEAMDECSMEGYDERLYAGHAASVYMAAWDAFHGQLCYCGDITNPGVIHRDDGPCHYPDHKEPEQEPDYKAIGQQAYESGYSTGYMDCAVKMKAQPKKSEQEPVAWMLEGWGPDCGPYFEIYRNDEMGWRDKKEWTPLYTTPYVATPRPQRKPLTDEEIGAILEGVNAYGTRLYTFARAIEAVHGIKENMNLQMNLAGIRADFEEKLQRTWVGLTDEEVRKIAYNTAELKVAKDIEAKLKEKNDC